MSKFKPQIMFKPTEFGKTTHITYKTYRELKKDIKRCLTESYDNSLTISRSKRGEWGEWFEKWSLQGNKLVIYKKGWM